MLRSVGRRDASAPGSDPTAIDLPTLQAVSRLLSSKPARTVLSVWSWFVLGVTLFVVVP